MITGIFIFTILAVVMSGWSLIAALTLRSVRYPDDELLEAFAHLIDEQALRITHLEKAIHQCWPTFKSYGEKFHD